MNHRRPLTSALSVLAVAGSLALPGAALAKGGDRPAPAPAPVAATVYCDWTLDGFTADGGSLFSNQAGDAGCLTVKALATGGLRFSSVALTPGWTYEIVANGEGTDSTVRVLFNQPVTGQKVDARVEYGRTYIK